MTENKELNRGILIYGLGIGLALFFIYLIVKDSNKTLLHAITPIQPMTQSTTQEIQQTNNIQLQQLQLQTQELQSQTQQISEQLYLQNNQLQLMQNIQLKHSNNITQLENAKHSNVVSMSNNSNYNNNINKIDNIANTTINPTINPIKLSNVSIEKDELTTDKIFGML